MDASTSVFMTLIPFAFFFLWVIFSLANQKGVVYRRFSRTTLLLSLVPLVAINIGLFYLLLKPGATSPLAPSPPVRMANSLVPPPAAVADPPKLVPTGPGPKIDRGAIEDVAARLPSVYDRADRGRRWIGPSGAESVSFPAQSRNPGRWPTAISPTPESSRIWA